MKNLKLKMPSQWKYKGKNMNNSLVKLRVINQDVKMKREEIEAFQTQSELLYNNLSRILSEDYVKTNHPVLTDSVRKLYGSN